MSKKLRQLGNSWGIVIPKPILNLLDINPMRDEIDFEVNGKELTIKKAKEIKSNDQMEL